MTQHRHQYRVEGSGPLGGRVVVPGDKSIGHRAVLFGALCDGVVEVSGLSGGEDNRSTMGALRALGVRIEEHGGGRATVHGVGLGGFRAASAALDCGNSGTTMRLLAGLLAAQPFRTTLVGDETLMRRPMKRVAEPLRQMGARVDGAAGKKPGDLYPPLEITGGPLTGIRYASPVASAQVKSAILIAGLYARGVTEVTEPGPSRDHTERMLARLGAPLTTPAPFTARVAPEGWDRRLRAQPLEVPGDPSSAAFLVAAALVAGAGPAGLVVENVCTNPTRTGFLDALAAMGARVELVHQRERCGEPVADLRIAPGGPAALRPVELGGELVVRAIDEIPILAVLAARARGTTVVRDAEELRVKESDRAASTVRMLRAFGVDAEERPDGLVVHGDPDRPLHPGEVESLGDHRIAMSGAVLALAVPRAAGASRILDTANVATSFPTFAELLRTLGASLES
jgi:3-phosphoshikimate 1-carboxyvinyltransferase